MEKIYRSLIINPGSTSTKIAVYDNDKEVFEKTLRHSSEEIDRYENIIDQYEFRKNVILETLKENDIKISELSFVAGRGGALKPIEGGTYEINDLVLEHCRKGLAGQHAANLSSLIGSEIAGELNIPSFIVDPPVVDELQELARVTGIEGIERKSIFHALNQKAVARRALEEVGKEYEKSNAIVAHMGGGISIGAHKNGRVIDVNNCYDGDGPLTPERAGSVPAGSLAKMCLSGDVELSDIRKKLTGKGGFVALLGTNDARIVSDNMVAGDAKSKLVYEAMCYQISKEIGSCAAVLKGQVDVIALTGGIAHDKLVVDFISEHIGFIAPVKVYPGEFEMSALAEGGLRVLRGEESAKTYQ